jgi:hypothetical protein
MEPHYEAEETTEEDHPMLRDTLIFALGKLAEAVVHRAFSERQVRDSYSEFSAMRGPKRDDSRQLAMAGVGDGVVQLFARSEKEEFLLRVRHARFSAAVPVGYDPDREEFLGLVLAEFCGSMPLAIHFARSMTRSIEQGLWATPATGGHVN